MSKNTITIALPFTEEPALHHDGWCSVSALGIETVKGRGARLISAADIEAAVRASWEEPATDLDTEDDDFAADPPRFGGSKEATIARLAEIDPALTAWQPPSDTDVAIALRAWAAHEEAKGRTDLAGKAREVAEEMAPQPKYEPLRPDERHLLAPFLKPAARAPSCQRHADCAVADAAYHANNDGRAPTPAFHSHDPDDDYPQPGARSFGDLLRRQGDVVGEPCGECGNVDGQQHGIDCSHARENRERAAK